MDQQQRILALLKKFEDGNISSAELAVLYDWYDSFEQEPKLTEGLSVEELAARQESLLNKINDKLHTELSSAPIVPLFPKILWRVGIAAVLVLCSLSVYFFRNSGQPVVRQQTTSVKDLPPGGDKAVLTLSDGSSIVLTAAKNGQLAAQANAIVRKTKDGELIYEQRETKTAAIEFNTVVTPRGGRYHLVLSDGTKVWINSASSIRYPVSFSGGQRMVKITGEVYFEVAHNPAKPFLVDSEQQRIEVLGTRFNVNAYRDEPAVTTSLLQGSVRINTAQNKIQIKPGQQSLLQDGRFALGNFEADEVLAWKSGLFHFSDENLESVMRKISRWYDVDIVYVDERIKKLPLSGIITQFSNISKVLHMLELTGEVRFVLSDHKITVSKT